MIGMMLGKVKMLAILAVVGSGLAFAVPSAQGGSRWSVGFSVGGPAYYAPAYRPVYAPPVYYYQPAPVVYAPAPTYYTPAPTYYAPAPTYYAPTYYAPAYVAPTYYAPTYYAPAYYGGGIGLNFSFGCGYHGGYRGGYHGGDYHGGWGHRHR